jgi:DNA-binding LacI/PurR family transcriptional regulator
MMTIQPRTFAATNHRCLMPSSPQRYQSLAAQVAARIAAEIEKGSWGTWLPGERTLTQTLQVSRKTLRKALAHLQREGTIKTRHGLGHEVLAAAYPHGSGDPQENTVGLLTPEALEYLRPYTALWVDELRSLLFENGVRLATFSGHRFFMGNPDKALARLIEQNPQKCWVLAHSNERIQHWFHDHQISCVLAGSSHPGLPLPNVDLDYFAICRHAAGAMMRLGHRRVALFTKQSERAGDLDSERGFEDGVRRSPHREVEAIIAHHDGTVEGAYRSLGRLFDARTPPTAMLVAQSTYYLTAIAFLAERGLRVPKQVSLMSRDDETFLAYLKPAPARYSCNPKTYAKRLLLQVQLAFEGETGAHTIHRIEPKFIPGGSLGPAP